jgi:sortase A
VARGLGFTLLTAGVLLGGFVGYELWVTSLFARHAQGGLQAELEERAAASAPALVPYAADPSLGAAPLTVPAGLSEPGEIDLAAALEAAGLPPVSSPPEGGMGAALLSELPPPDGDAVGRIRIPSAGVDWTVVEGVTPGDLRRGAGHMPNTALPGQPGNAVISGHRTTYGAPFYHLDRVVPGDLITVTTVTGTHAYQVVQSLVVRPSEMWVTEQWQGAWLTLTTCHPRLSSRERLVVVARLVGGPNLPAIARGAS